MVFKATIRVQARLLHSMLQVVSTDKDPREILRGLIVIFRKNHKPRIFAMDGTIMLARDADYFIVEGENEPEVPEETKTISKDYGLAVLLSSDDLKQVLAFHKGLSEVFINVEYDKERYDNEAYWSAISGNTEMRFACKSNGRVIPDIFGVVHSVHKGVSPNPKRFAVNVEIMQRMLNAAKKIGAYAVDLSSADFENGKPCIGTFFYSGHEKTRKVDGVEDIEIFYVPLKLKREKPGEENSEESLAE